MGLELAKAWIRVRGDSSELARDLGKSKQQVEQAFSNMATSVRLVSAAAYAAGAGFLYMGMRAAAAREQTVLAFEVMLGSAKQAQEVIADLTKFAAETPFEMPEILQAARGLVQFGDRGKEMMDTLKDLGNAASATNTQFGMLALIFNQVRGVSKLMTQDFRQLSTRGVISLQDIADHFDITREAAAKMLSTGSVTFEDLRNILRELSEEGGRYFNMMERQSKTLLGLWSTLKDDAQLLAAEIAGPLVAGLKLLMKWIVHIKDNYGEWVKALVKTVFIMGSVVAAFKAYAMAQKAAAAATIVLQSVSLGPKGWAKIGVGIGLAAAAITSMNMALGQTIESFDEILADIKETAKADKEVLDGIEKQIKARSALATAIATGRESFHDLWYEYRLLTGEMTELDVDVSKLIERLKALGLSWNWIHMITSEFVAVQNAIDELKLRKELEEGIDAVSERFRRMREDIAMVRGELTESEKAARDFARSLDKRLPAHVRENMLDEFKKIRAEMEKAEAGKKFKDRASQIRDSLKTPTENLKDYLKEIIRLRKGGFLSKSTAARAVAAEETKLKDESLISTGRFGFQDLGRSIQDALLQRDDPQKKMAKELIRQTKALLGIEEAVKRPKKATAVVG